MPDPTTSETTPTAPPYDASPESVRKALTFFVIMAFVVGVGLLLLVAGMVLKYAFDQPWLTEFWAQPHGFFFIVYVGATANLGFKLRWSMGRMLLVMLAGCVPFLSFWAERKVTAEVRARLGERATAAR